jgi:hypothetical protein
MSTSVPSAAPGAFPGGDPEARLLQMICGYRVSQVVRAFAYFGIADLLADGPSGAAALGAAANADPGAIGRLLRAGVPLGLVTTDRAGLFQATPLLLALRAGAPGSMRDVALGFTAPSSWLPFGRLVEAVRTGEAQAEAALGSPFFTHFSAHAADKAHFTAAMDGVSAQVADALVTLVDGGRHAIGVDVGGATGVLIRRLVEAYPGLRGVVFEHPQVAGIAAAAVERAGLADAVAVVAGDFFAGVPAADLYLLKWILHDWDDAHCVRILANCRASLTPGGSVVIIEMAIDPPSDAWFATLLDLSMLTLLNGRERTIDAYDALLGRAGLVRVRRTDIPSPLGRFHVIEAVAA